jgi:hypothetical protein
MPAMAALFIWIWIIGGFPAAILSEVVRAESPRTARVGRVAFALVLWVDLLIAALMLSVGADAPSSPMSRELWWVTVVGAGIPLALVSGYAVRRGYTGSHRVVHAAASLLTAGLYVALPLGFVPFGHKLTGLALWVHDHHLLGLAILLVPTLLLLADELRRTSEEVPGPEPGDPGLAHRRLPRRNLVGGVVFVGVLVWMAGTNASGMLLGLGIILVGLGLFLWRKDRLAMRTALRDLGPFEKP